MRKTILERTLGATWPRTHVARFPINDEGRFHAYFGARDGGKSRFDPWKPLTREDILSDIKKLGEACYGVQEEVCKAYERMTGKK